MVVAAGAPVLRLAHDGPRDVVFSVPEDKVGAAARWPGQARRVAGAALGRRRRAAAGHVREVAAAADPATRTFLVKADVGSAPRVRLGQTATVLIELPADRGRDQAAAGGAVRGSRAQTAVWLLDRRRMTVKPQAVEVAGADGNEVVVARRPGAGPGRW